MMASKNAGVPRYATNGACIEALQRLEREARSSGVKHLSFTYAKALKSLKSFEGEIKSGKDAMQLPGIGKHIAGKLEEALKEFAHRTQQEATTAEPGLSLLQRGGGGERMRAESGGPQGEEDDEEESEEEMPVPSGLEDWLLGLGLPQYKQAFLASGFDNIKVLQELGMSDLEAVGVPLLGHRKTLLLASQELKEAVLHNQELQRNRKKRHKKNKQKALLQRRSTLPSLSSTASISSPTQVSASLSASSTPISRSLSVDSLSRPSSSSRSPSFQVAPPRHFERENDFSATSTASTTSTTEKGSQPAKVPKLIALKGTLPVVDSMFILMNSSEESYAKGQATFQRGAIASLILNGREILAEVEGGGTYGRGRLHKVNLSLTKPKSLLPPNNNEDDGEEERAIMKKIVMVKRAVCSCSYDREGWCKHIVATLLCLLHKQNAETTPTRRRQVQQSSIREFAADKTSPSTSSTTKKRKNDEGDDDKEEGDDDRTQTETRHKRTKRRQPDQTQMRGKQKRTEAIPRKYIPRYRSGAWALLQALIRAEQEEIVRNYPGYLSKKQLLDLAGPYCDSSFYAESTGFGSGQNFYTAWNSMATLIGKGLVQKKGAPAKYSLTESGRQLAQSLLAAEQEETTNNPSSKWQQNDDVDEENDDDENETERTKQKTEKEMKNKVLLKLDDTSSSSDDESAATKNKAKEDDEADQNEKQDKDPTWIGSGSTVNDDTIMMMEEPTVWAPSASTTVFIAEPNPYSPQYRPEEGPEQKHLSPLLPGPSEELEKDNEPQESTSSRFDADVLAVHTTFATPASAASISLPFNFDIEGEQKVEIGMTTYTTLLRAKTEECPNKKERSSSTCATTVIELSESDDEKHETDEKHSQTIEPRKHEEKKELRTIKVENVLQVLSEEEEEKDNEENEADMLSVGKDDRTNYTSSFSSSQSLFLDLTDIEPQTSPTKSFRDEFLPTSTSASQTSTKEKTKRFAQGSIISSTFSSKNKKQTNATTKHREKVITSFEIVLVLDNREIHEKPAYKTMFKRLRESGILCEARALALGDMLWIARIAYQTKLLHSHQRKNKDAKANEEGDEEDTEEDLELDQRWDETDSGEEEYVLGQIAERKTMADMLASIQDKRYQEQKFRLSQLCAANRVSTVLYILEGVNVAMNSDNSNSHKDVDALQMELLRDAIVETQTVDGFYVVRTDNERHTANYLRELTHHIESLYHRSKWAYRHSSSSSSSSSSSCSSSAAAAAARSSGDEPASLFLWNNRSMLSYSRFNLLASKSGNLTLKHLFAKQLMQIPNCQAAKARAIVDSYSTPAALFEAYVAMEEEDKAREEREERREEERELTKNNREKEKRRKERRKEELLKDLRMEEEGEAGNSSHVHVAVGPATSKRVYHFYNDLT